MNPRFDSVRDQKTYFFFPPPPKSKDKAAKNYLNPSAVSISNKYNPQDTDFS